MPVPLRLRHPIGYATRFLPGPLSVEEIRERVAIEFPTYSEADIDRAVGLAVEFRRAGRRATSLSEAQRGYTSQQFREAGMDFDEARRLSGRRPRIPPRQSLLDTPALQALASGTISARVYVTGELQNGERIQMSLVFQFDDTATHGTVTSRIAGFLLSGAITGTRYKYQFKTFAVDFLTVVPYARANAIPLDVAPITRHHPNPYPLSP